MSLNISNPELLSKLFHPALSNLSSITGINGAGKTTTFKMLTGEIHPDGGDASLANYG